MGCWPEWFGLPLLEIYDRALFTPDAFVEQQVPYTSRCAAKACPGLRRTVVSLIFLGQLLNLLPTYSAKQSGRHNIQAGRFVDLTQSDHHLPSARHKVYSPRQTEHNEGGFRAELAF